MAFFSADELRAEAKVALRESAWIQKSAAVELRNFAEGTKQADRFDIFLSHSYQDQDAIYGLRLRLIKTGYRVYVDWIDDAKLDRSKVDKATADKIRERMRQCQCLFYATSENAVLSKWMPWELGYMDALTNRKAAICPIDGGAGDDYTGQEYLGLHPYVTVLRSSGALWIHEDAATYVRFDDWLRGEVPRRRT